MEEKLCIDDPVGAFPTHALAAVWGLIATGLFCEQIPEFAENAGLFKGGTWKFFGIQILAIVSIAFWSAITTFILLYMIDKTFGLRMTDAEEEVGADYYVHNIRSMEDDSSISGAENARTTSTDVNDTRNQCTEESPVMKCECPSVDMKGLREIDSSPSSKREKIDGIGDRSKISLQMTQNLDRHWELSKAKRNSGYHST